MHLMSFFSNTSDGNAHFSRFNIYVRMTDSTLVLYSTCSTLVLYFIIYHGFRGTRTAMRTLN